MYSNDVVLTFQNFYLAVSRLSRPFLVMSRTLNFVILSGAKVCLCEYHCLCLCLSVFVTISVSDSVFFSFVHACMHMAY